MKTKISEFLIESKKLIENESTWTQGFYARTKDGVFIDSHSDRAVCYCSVGAMLKVRGPRGITEAHHALSLLQNKSEDHLRRTMGASAVPDFNDSNTHAVVMEAWDKAINSAIEKGI